MANETLTSEQRTNGHDALLRELRDANDNPQLAQIYLRHLCQRAADEIERQSKRRFLAGRLGHTDWCASLNGENWASLTISPCDCGAAWVQDRPKCGYAGPCDYKHPLRDIPDETMESRK